MVVSCQIIKRNHFLLEAGSHPMDSIIIVLDGSFCCETHGQTYVIGKHDIFLFKRGDRFRRKTISPITAIYIVFDSHNFDCNQKLRPTHHTRINEDIELLVNAIAKDDTQAENHFIHDILYCHQNGIKEADSLIQDVIQYLQKNYHHNLSLDHLAQQFGVSKQWLIIRFKRETNATPITYLTHLRMKKAKEFLLNPQMRIGEIALACGFDTPYYFSNTFKKTYGISPTAWRKNMIL